MAYLCKLNWLRECDACGSCERRGTEPEAEEEPEITCACSGCGKQLFEGDECYMFPGGIVLCQECINNAYNETLREAVEHEYS